MLKDILYALLVALIAGLVVCNAAEPVTEAKLARELVMDIRKGATTRIAVLEFAYADGRASQGPSVVQERLTTALVHAKAGKVIERRQLYRVMGELNLQASGAVDPTTAKQIGKVLGAEYVVIGTLNDVGDTLTEVNARLVDVETAEIVAACTERITKTWDDKASAYTAKGDSDIERLKLSLDAKLAHIHKRLWKDFVPLQDGRFSVDGVVMTNEEFTEFLNKEMHVNDPNALNN